MEQTLPSWLKQIDDNLWEVVEPLRFMTDKGQVEIAPPFRTDLYTMVPNTPYPLMWLPPVLHDFLLKRLQAGKPVPGFEKRKDIDIAFYNEMVVQAALVFMDQVPILGKAQAIKILLKLLRLSEMYYYGVRGYGWLWQLFN